MNDGATGARRYRLISADGHFNEPGDLWTARVPAAMRDRAPRIEAFEEGDAWVIEGVDDPINFGMNACAGLDPSEMKGWMRFEDMRRGGWDPAARIEEMDQDGVDAEVLYPTPRLSSAIAANRDADFHHAMVRAYNDWISEFASYAPDRFGAVLWVPNRGVEEALAEIDRVAGRPGVRGAMMLAWPHGGLSLKPEDDKVFAALCERGLSLNIHVAMTQTMPAAHKAKLPGYGRFFDAPNRMIQMIFDGVFDRFPELDVVFAETDFGWVPYVKEQIDNNYLRLDPVSRFGLQMLPSEYISRHFHFGYMTDTFGLRNLVDVGAHRVMWSSDYPHISADWPHSWKVIQSSMSGISAEDRHAVLAGNAMRLYGFGR